MTDQPQPPRDGEPDWEMEIEQAFFVLGIKTLSRDEIRAELKALAQHGYRLGLSHARPEPKVADAEVADFIKYLETVRMDKAATIVRRLSTKLAETEARLSEADAVIWHELEPVDTGPQPAHHLKNLREAKARHQSRQQGGKGEGR